MSTMTPTATLPWGGDLRGFESIDRGYPWLADVQHRIGRLGRLRWKGRHRAYPLAKRAIDIAVAGSMLVILGPFLACIALVIRCQDGGPAFYVQDRVGAGGRLFRFPKFRTMCVDSDLLRARVVEAAGQGASMRFKDRNDPRITPFGRILRRTSLDELPQLWSVLKGDMALVGPRPAIPSEVDCYDQMAWRRLDVPQGLTCGWQVNGRSELDFTQQVELDLSYVQGRGLWCDLGLLLRTPFAVVSGRGAY